MLTTSKLFPCSLPAVERARRYLATMPAAETGQRGHDATFHTACVLVHAFALGEDAAFALLAAEFNPRCLPPWSATDLGRKVREAAAATPTKPRGYLLGNIGGAPQASFPPVAPEWLPLDEKRRAEIVAAGIDTADLCDRSPLAFEEDRPAEIVERLFSSPALPDPLLCIGMSSAVFATRPLSVWLTRVKLATSALIVPSPMCALTGRTKQGKVSEHTLENTGPRRFLVVEFDQGTTNEHAALLWHLAGVAPLALVVHSGGKSLHSWFYCHGQPEDSLRRFMSYAVSIGADRATWTRSQFVRLPAGQRENGARQRVLYFDPAAVRNAETPHE